jgi:hypothetical protein
MSAVGDDAAIEVCPAEKKLWWLWYSISTICVIIRNSYEIRTEILKENNNFE